MLEEQKISNVVCHLSASGFVDSKRGYATGILLRQSTKLTFVISNNLERDHRLLEIEDVAGVSFCRLEYSAISVVKIERHMHHAIYFRTDALFPGLFFTYKSNNEIFDLCKSCITNLEENQYCINEKVKIDKLMLGIKNLDLALDIKEKKFASEYVYHLILQKIQSDDDFKLFVLLINNDFDINGQIPGWVNGTTFNTSLINYAIKKNLYKIGKYLLDEGINLNYKTKGQAPIHIACKNKNLKFCKLLYNYHAYLDLPNDFGDTPLTLSIQATDIATVKFLIEKNVNITTRHLQQAIEMNDIDIIHVIVQKILTLKKENYVEILTDALSQSKDDKVRLYLDEIKQGVMDYNKINLLNK
ncbi:MAG: ankyrin repeat domain-containing protein [Gammaproteobacteria bacterium]